MHGAIALETAEATPGIEHRFAALVGSHRDRALRLAWRLVGGDEAAAEDVTQEAFARAYEGLHRFRGEAALSTWFYRILVRQAASHRRWRRVRDVVRGDWREDLPDPQPAAAPDPALRARIGRALDGLSRGQRECFVLVHLEGFTVTEAAEILGRKSGTVKSHLHRALRALRAELADLDPAAGAAESEAGR